MLHEGLTALKFAQQLGVQPSTISHILSGRNYPRFEMLSAIMRNYPEISERWLMLGEGEMVKAKPEVTNVIPAVMPEPVVKSEPEKPESAVESKSEKPVSAVETQPAKTTDKIVFFNSDGTFAVYSNK